MLDDKSALVERKDETHKSRGFAAILGCRDDLLKALKAPLYFLFTCGALALMQLTAPKAALDLCEASDNYFKFQTSANRCSRFPSLTTTTHPNSILFQPFYNPRSKLSRCQVPSAGNSTACSVTIFLPAQSLQFFHPSIHHSINPPIKSYPPHY